MAQDVAAFEPFALYRYGFIAALAEFAPYKSKCRFDKTMSVRTFVCVRHIGCLADEETLITAVNMHCLNY